ncbi:MAG: hypothetical protein OJF49_003850 [Ktedonobacterales bacterium]|jgi:DMSO/TMAO reductase YedYZ molybdopterin-dependent catalytic subunit|nr:MAG: hypothetical protein OJF49_003850 [Ktedonobacterales bacterium]
MKRLRQYTEFTWRALKRNALGLAAGLLGSLAAIVVMLALRLAWGTPTPPELLGERILPLMSADQFVALLIRFQPNEKTGPLGLTLLGQFAVGVLLGPLYERLAGVGSSVARWLPTRRGWLAAGGLALAMEIVALVVFWPVLPEGLYGDPIGRARLLTLLALALTFAAYAGVTAVASATLRYTWEGWLGQRRKHDAGMAQAAPDEAARVNRRAALAMGGGAVLAVAGAGAIVRLLSAYLARSNLSYEGHGTPSPTAAITPITPRDEFYVVSKNVLDPVVSADRWQLEVTGLVRRSKVWSYDQIRRLASETRAITLECISNEVGGHLLSTAVWRGVALATLLAEAGGALPSGKYVIFRSVDGYATSLPLADLLEARTLLAWEMNGQELPARHGFPLRAVVPGRYGEQSAKWLTQIEIADHEFKGFYQSQGWSAAQLETLSRIDAPVRNSRLPVGPVPVTGVAFAGIRGIQRVEVSADGGATWHTATLMPPLSDQSWVFWNWTWQPTTSGSYTLVVRATDGTGVTQTPAQRGTVPNGATGWQRVKVQIG